MRFTVKHTFNVSAEKFWSDVFFSDDFNRELYLTALGFSEWKVVEQKDLGGGAITRRVHMVPPQNAPAVVQKLVGGQLAYDEIGKLDPATKRWKYEIVPTKMADKVKISGEFWVEPRGEKLERFCSVDCSVKIFGVGGVVEAFIEKQTRDSYDKAAEFTNRWVAKQS